ncbi:MAG: ABC transporter ATP-binding protein [Coprothermobacterota bacterium]|nr:ABC transporter ATP-binding protein [Coprothermobacterota bacterium]
MESTTQADKTSIPNILVEMLGISKVYPDNNVTANSNVHFNLQRGEIHALVGENGAGKTTLMKILCGLERADQGTIKVGGRPVHIRSARDADRLGIGMVHQRFCLVENFSVADNIVLGKEPLRGGIFYDRAKAKQTVKVLSEDYGFEMDPNALVGTLTVGQKQRVEILKVLYRGSTILVLDEPTSLLTEQEIKVFFRVLRQLKTMGYTIVIITHKLEEVGQISDRVTVMREGQVVDSRPSANLDKATLARLMVGKEVLLQVEKPAKNPGLPVLEIRDLSLIDPTCPRPLLAGINLRVRAGEVLGIAGVAGNGLGELEDVLTGMNSRGRPSGQVLIEGLEVLGHSPARLRRMGLAYVPADRLQRGSSLALSLSDNLIVVNHHVFLRFGILRNHSISKFSNDLIQRFGIKGNMSAPIGTLSGGNIQKAVLSRELSRRPKLLIISEPTWGLDVACSEFVYQEIIEMRGEETAILLISSNLDEVLALSDQVAVMYKGEVVALFPNVGLDRESLGGYMLGLHRQEVKEKSGCWEERAH